MSLRARIFIIISVVVLLILSISIFLVVRNKNKAAVTSPPTGSENNSTSNQPGSVTNPATQIPEGLPVKPLTALEIEQNGVQQLAKVFIERYGTYSTDNNFDNIRESKPLVTANLWSKISTGINAKTTESGFLGLTTKVASVQITSWTDTKVALDLKVVRNENKNGVASSRYQDVTVEMVKENNVWLANSLVWK